MQDQVKILFEYFYSKVHRSSYNLDIDRDVNSKLIANFSKRLSKHVILHSVGNNLLIDYFAFAFGYYHDKKLKRNISLNWIIGQKMVKRFFEREEGWDYYTKRFLHEYQVDLDQLRSKLEQQDNQDKNYLAVHKSEELEKSRVPDTEARVYSCLNTTTLFNHRSTICIMCHQRVFCKQLLKKINPTLYTRRGYDAN